MQNNARAGANAIRRFGDHPGMAFLKGEADERAVGIRRQARMVYRR